MPTKITDQIYLGYKNLILSQKFILLEQVLVYQRRLTNKQRMLHKNHSGFRPRSYNHKQYYILLKLR